MLNECISKGLKVKSFCITYYVCWGTDIDYETFLYWQSYFHKLNNHPYKIEKDTTANKEKNKK